MKINYLIFIQIELFDKYGFIWHKLSLSNIIIEKNDELIKNIYISDLDNSCILDPKYGFVEYYNQNFIEKYKELDMTSNYMYNNFQSVTIHKNSSNNEKLNTLNNNNILNDKSLNVFISATLLMYHDFIILIYELLKAKNNKHSKEIRSTVTGDGNVEISIAKVDIPTPADDEVLIEIYAASIEDAANAVAFFTDLPQELNSTLSVVKVRATGAYVLIVENNGKNIELRWGTNSENELKARVYKALLALPENADLKRVDVSAPHAPIVK